MTTETTLYTERAAAIIAALILLQTLYFKFSAHPDSVYIFTKIGGKPFLRIGSGIAELIIALLLLFPGTSLYGGILGVVLMLGAIGQHLFVLGINVNNDGGVLFALAVTTLLCCAIVVILMRIKLGRIKIKG